MRTVGIILAALVLATAVLPYSHSGLAVAQTPAKPKGKAAGAPPATEVSRLPPERVEADVSSRTIAVTSGYSGSEILVFGTIENSRQPSAESGFYDVAVVVEGEPEPLMVRKKGRIGGLWVNTSTFSFNSVPSYYAVASTRPLEEFADAALLDEAGIGLDAVRMAPSAASAVRVSSEDLIAYKDAVRRLKQGAQLFKRDDYGVIFTGRSLFRATIAVPATVPVVPLTARVFLFHEGKLLSRYQARVVLEREGIERWLYAFATDRPFLYGLVAVLIAVATGLIASALLRRRVS